jgi:dihydrolipoamide dehydrogenase
MSEKKYDLIVVGGGPGGYVAAIRGCQLGLKTALIEKEHLGGICLNWGCIPTKALLRVSEVNHLLSHLDEFGLSGESFSFDIKKIVDRSRSVANQLNSGISHLLKKNKVEVLEGAGELLGNGIVSVTSVGKQTYQVSGTNVVLATGARARSLPGLEPDGDRIWTYREAMIPDQMPRSLLVIGSGAIGIEFASFYRDMGADVTVVEMMDRILPVEDKEISKMARIAFEKRGIKIYTGVSVGSLKANKRTVAAEISFSDGSKEKMTFDRAVLAIGIVGNIEGIGLENTKIRVEKSHVVTNSVCETDEPGVYAIGDLTGPPWLAHKASHEAIIAVEHIGGLKTHPLNKDNIPGCTYCRPQIASVGLTEERAKELGIDLKIGKFPLIANGKAIALGETEGLVKTIFNSVTGELLGAHMIGPEVTEQIQGYVIAKVGEMTEAELMHTIFPHPTLSEAMHESVLDAFGKAIHI